MQELHVRKIFNLFVPLRCNETPKFDLNNALSNFGFTITYPSDSSSCHYRLNLYSDTSRREQVAKRSETSFTSLLEWAKKAPFTLKKCENNTSIEAIILRLRIGPGFDFRKIPKRFVRFEIECFVSGIFQFKGSSKICRLLGKRRKALSSDVDEVLIPFAWETESQPPDSHPAEEQLQYSSNDEESPSLQINDILLKSQPAPLLHHEHMLQLLDEEEIISTPNTHENDTTPVGMFSDALGTFNYVHHNSEQTYETNHDSTIPGHNMILTREYKENYMVLYNGNAEVIGNFRALNFYKASDINIKEDIKLLLEERDPRGVLLHIDGVSYKFKPGTTHSTQRRFVGYIAQQIESVVPEAVQLIDGILHVDYESLIPYLSESIKHNFNDIRGLKSESERIRQALDLLYYEFVAKDTNTATKETDAPSTNTLTSRIPRWLWVVVVLVIFFGLTASVVILLSQPVVSQEPSPHIGLTIAEELDREVLIKLFTALDGPRWLRNDGWNKTGIPHCKWHGVSCLEGRVASLDLHGYNLLGTIPQEIDNLDQLKYLDLSSNHLQGTIPRFLPSQLDTINLSHNKNLTGILPWKLPACRFYVGGCNLQGTIPTQFFHSDLACSSIISINMSFNALGGAIPTLSLNNDVDIFDLSNNQFTGTIPWLDYKIILQHVFYSVFDLSHNHLTGTIPSISVNSELKLSHNSLSGTVPSMVLFRTRLKVLDLSHNDLDGEFYLIEDEEGWSRLEYIDISHNNFTWSNFTPLNTTAVAYCDATKNSFKCPISTWMTSKCSATCL